MRSLLARARSVHPARADALLALAFLVESSLEVLLAVPGHAPHRGLVHAGLVVAAGAVALRRRLPLATVVVAWALFVGESALPTVYMDHLVSPFFVLLFLVYSAGRHLDDRLLLPVGVIGVAAMSAGLTIDAYDDSVGQHLMSWVFGVAAPLLIGRFVRHRAQLHATLREKTARLERERLVRADVAAAEERTRIAGELHDVVAHALSAMVVQGSAARRLATRDPARAEEAFRAVEHTGREALTEIRLLLGVLRREDEEIALAPQPSLRHVNSLVTRMRAAGLPVQLTVDGEAGELPAGIDLTAYRVIQEALKGALEQGHAGRADVRLRFRPDHVALEVDDDGAAPERVLPGVRERVSLYGGQLRATARRDGGHVVRARLPLGGAA